MRSVRHFCKEVRQHPELYFSGIQPTGVPHLGNYFGFIEPWIQLQSVSFYVHVVRLKILRRSFLRIVIEQANSIFHFFIERVVFEKKITLCSHYRQRQR